jgi:DNA-binding response OmpR family regulator
VKPTSARPLRWYYRVVTLKGFKARLQLLVDYNLPGQNGLQVASALRERCPNLSVILITGNTDSTLRDQARDFGADYLPKPLDLSELLSRTRENYW